MCDHDKDGGVGNKVSSSRVVFCLGSKFTAVSSTTVIVELSMDEVHCKNDRAIGGEISMDCAIGGERSPFLSGIEVYCNNDRAIGGDISMGCAIGRGLSPFLNMGNCLFPFWGWLL